MINKHLMTPVYLTELAKVSMAMPFGLGHLVISKHGDSWSPYYRFLHMLVKTFKPAVAVECGVYCGIGSCHMAMADSDLLVVGIDIAFHESVHNNTDLFPNIHLVEGDTRVSAHTVEKIIGDKKIDLLFLDSAHDGETPKAEFAEFFNLFADPCIIVCDDVAYPIMADFWAWLPGNKTRLDFLHPSLNEAMYDNPGFGVSIV